MTWKRIATKKKELNLCLTLLGGQSFRWKQIENNVNEETFLGVNFMICLFIVLKQISHMADQI